jgi:hypothetical protein
MGRHQYAMVRAPKVNEPSLEYLTYLAKQNEGRHRTLGAYRHEHLSIGHEGQIPPLDHLILCHEGRWGSHQKDQGAHWDRLRRRAIQALETN